MSGLSKALSCISVYFLTVLVMALFGWWVGSSIAYLNTLSFGDWWGISIIVVVFWSLVSLYRVIVEAITSS